ncbi:TetR/AcrR family transcriptional regulator [Zavarzinella formosa]|uniref:TetR/AcrR family transcriptional regulator n=1 Tax=Zavarzinella formosa TaxID=360055 RepID=UPI00031AEFD7|nr:TetR/AcrR family transcriptional regulator [Zavarzinella formosa]
MGTKTPNHRPPADSVIARARREQIVEAAVGIIISQGLHNLSLSKIERETRMKRGQLTYYFPTKEDILLAVFDRLLALLISQVHGLDDIKDKHGLPGIWEMITKALTTVLGRSPVGWEFHALQYTFLAQMAHREDFREKLATSFGEMRMGMGAHWSVSANPTAVLAKKVSPKTIASLFQAIMHGLTMQLAVDPDAFDRGEMLELCVGLLAPLFIKTTAKKTGRERPQ